MQTERLHGSFLASDTKESEVMVMISNFELLTLLIGIASLVLAVYACAKK